MFTPEDELDGIDHRLGEIRRRIHNIDQASLAQIVDEDELVKRRRSYVAELRVLEREREVVRARVQEEAFAGGLTSGLEEWLGGRP